VDVIYVGISFLPFSLLFSLPVVPTWRPPGSLSFPSRNATVHKLRLFKIFPLSQQRKACKSLPFLPSFVASFSVFKPASLFQDSKDFLGYQKLFTICFPSRWRPAQSLPLPPCSLALLAAFWRMEVGFYPSSVFFPQYHLFLPSSLIFISAVQDVPPLAFGGPTFPFHARSDQTSLPSFLVILASPTFICRPF